MTDTLRDAPEPLTIFVLHASHLPTDHQPHGDGLVAWRFVVELAARGHRVYVAAPEMDVIGAIPPNVTVLDVGRLPIATVPKYLAYVARVRRLYAEIAKRERIDVVHQMNPVIRGLSLGWLGTRAPVVLGTFVGDWPWERPGRPPRPPLSVRASDALKRAIDVVQQRAVDGLALTTPYALNRVPFARGMRDRIAYVHHGIDVAEFAPEARPGDPAPRPNSVLFLGSISEHKGIIAVLDAFEAVVRAEPSAVLVLAGVGPALEWTTARVRAAPWAANVELVGAVRRADVAGWMRACTVFVAPSHGEPYGQSVLEAMACAKPVIVTNYGGVAYLAPDAGSRKIAPGDAAALAAAMLEVLRDPALARAMGERNRAVAVERNAWPRVVEALEALYRSAIVRKRRGASGGSAGTVAGAARTSGSATAAK